MTAQTTVPADQAVRLASFEDFDAAFPALGELTGEINKVLARRDRRIRRIEQGYAVQLLPLLSQAQELYDAIRAYADVHREEMVPRGKKTADRPLGRVSWRSNPHVETDLPDDQILENLFRLGGEAQERFVRTVTTTEVDRAAMLKPENRELAESVGGVAINREEDFYVQAVGMAKPFVSSRPFWPFPAEIDGREVEASDREGVVDILRAALQALEPAA
jgi:phage host-nuclease inhibitor protein Gam